MLIAVVPVRSLAGAKSRLGEVLDAEEREALVADLLDRAVAALAATPSVDRTIVVSEDDRVLARARDAGALALRQLGGGLNAALDQARTVALELGAERLIVVPGDLSAVSPEALAAVVDAAPPAPSVTLVADRHREGTNTLLLAPPDIVRFAFGPDSRRQHRLLAAAAGAAFAELDGPLNLDLDTPDDLLLAREAAG